MKIGIDISQIVYSGTGVARYTRGLVEAILKFDRENKWLFFFSGLRRKLPKDIKDQILNSSHRLVSKKIPPTLIGFLWNDLHWPPIEDFINQLDWFISSDWAEPPARKIKKATIVHDLAFRRYPETINRMVLHYQRRRLNWIKKETRIIFADSSSTKKDLVKFYSISPEKVVIAYPGLNKIEKKSIPPKNINRRESFILTVGKMEPRKNLQRLFNSYLKLAPALKLYVVGPKGWGKVAIKDKEKIKFLGQVSDQELKWLYQNCLVFVYPSIWEGFGYPLLEAMSYGKPVLTSHSSSLKEIAANSALFFNPFDEGEMGMKLKQIINDRKLRETLSRQGQERANRFNWQRTLMTIVNHLA